MAKVIALKGKGKGTASATIKEMRKLLRAFINQRWVCGSAQQRKHYSLMATTAKDVPDALIAKLLKLDPLMRAGMLQDAVMTHCADLKVARKHFNVAYDATRVVCFAVDNACEQTVFNYLLSEFEYEGEANALAELKELVLDLSPNASAQDWTLPDDWLVDLRAPQDEPAPPPTPPAA